MISLKTMILEQFGLEIGEEFGVKGYNQTFRIVENFVIEVKDGDTWCLTVPIFLSEIIDNPSLVVKKPKNLLTEYERDIFSKVVDLQFITKIKNVGYKNEYIYVNTAYGGIYLDLECKGLKVGKQYSKEELGL